MKENRFGFLSVAIMFMVLAVIGAVIWFVVFYETATDTSTSEGTAIVEDTNSQSVFKSKLYPAVMFAVVDGWEITEPADYSQGIRPADAEIILFNGEFELTLPFMTAIPAGFEAIRCYRDSNLKLFDIQENDADFVRYKQSGIYHYDFAYTANHPDFAEFTTPSDLNELVDENPNYCTVGGILIIGGINSTVIYDPSATEYDNDEDGYFNAWLMRPFSNKVSISSTGLAEMDIMLLQLYENVKD